MWNLRTTVVATTMCAILASSPIAARQKSDKSSKEQDAKRPKLSLRAQPQIAVAPARITLTAELTGGPDDYQEFYCPSVEWEWGDDTTSESTTDCEPYEAGKSQIKRRYTVQHEFRRAGSYRIFLHLKQKDRGLASASATVQVQPGLSGAQ
jgi:hypothetical protein